MLRFGKPSFFVASGAAVLLLVSASAPLGLDLTLSDGEAGSGVVEIVFLATSITQVESDPRTAWKIYFERAHPKFKVRLIAASENSDTSRAAIMKMIKNSDAGTIVPDVYLGDVIWPALFGKEGVALPLNSMFRADFWHRFDPDMLKAASYNGQVYSVPFYRERGLLFYRKDLLEKIGKSVPRTWEELAEISRQLISMGVVEHGFVWQGAPYEGLTCNWLEFAADAGAQVLDPDRTRSQINSPQSLNALKFMRSLIAQGVSPQEVTRYQERDAMELFNSGKAAFLRAWSAVYTGLVNQDGALTVNQFPVGVAELPTFAGQTRPGYSTIGGWNLFVNPKIKESRSKREAVSAFIEWITDVPGQHILAQYGETPANVSVRSMDGLRGNPVLSMADRARPVRSPHELPTYYLVSEAIYTEVHRALTGELSPEAALANAENRINRVLAG